MRVPWMVFACFLTTVLVVTAPAHGKEPDSLTHALWQSAAREQAGIEARYPLLQDEKLQRYLAHVLRRLRSKSSSDLPPMQLRIIQDNRPQAVTYPNGICYLTTGMLVSLASEDQLAMILAHEMTHYHHQDTRRAWDYMQILADSSRSDDQPDHVQTRALNLMDFDEAAELEADAHGLELMQKAGYCPYEVISLLRDIYAAADTSASGAGKTFNARLHAVEKRFNTDDAPAACGREPGRRNLYDKGIAPALVADSRLALQRGSWMRARKDLARYGAVCPVDAEAFFLRGELLRHQTDARDQKAAISAYESAIGLDRNFAPAYRALGLMQFKLGRKAAAKSYFETFLALIPDSPDNFFIRNFLRQCEN